MFLFILNPVAGKGRSLHAIEQVKKIFNAHCQAYDIWETTYAGEATELARKAAQEGFRNIVSVGGDGTVLEVATGLIGTGCTMGIIPAGTGNDFVRSLGIAPDVEQAAEVLLAGNTGKVDIGKTEDDKYFLNIAGCGFDTEVLCCMDGFKKNFKGQLPYILGLIKALFGYKCIRAKIELDDTVIEQEIFIAAFANGKTYGGGMNVAPAAEVTDGMFDVTVVDSVSRLTVLTILPNFIKGRHEKIKQIKSYRSKTVRITCEKEVPLNMDGEIIGMTPKFFELVPAALDMFVPKA